MREDRVTWSPGWPQPLYVAEDDPELVSSACKKYRRVRPYGCVWG